MRKGPGFVTVTKKEQTEKLPLGSLARQFTVVVPTGKTEPGGGRQEIETLVSLGSEAVTFQTAVAPIGWQAARVMLEGQETIGEE